MNGKIILNNQIRHLIRVIFASLIALMICYYFSFTPFGWLLFATIFVMLTPTGSALFQGLLRFFLLVGIVTIGSLLFSSASLFYTTVNEITLGAVIGIIINVLVIPDRVNVEFCRAVTPILQSYANYFSGIVELLITHQPGNTDKDKIIVESNLQRMPSWVYEPGLDIAMQKGYRYFFMKLAHVGEILFAMHHLARYHFNEDLLSEIKQSLMQSVLRVEQFIAALITLLELKKLTEGVIDFYDEIVMIEENFKKTVPHSLELLDVDKQHVYFAEFIYDLKDLRNALILLAKALRQQSSKEIKNI